MASLDDRLSALQAHDTQFTGIAFVNVIRPGTTSEPCDPFMLRVYFQTDIRKLTPPFSGTDAVELTPASIVIHEASGDPNVPDLPVLSLLGYGPEDPHPAGVDPCLRYLDLTVNGPKDFRKYRLRIDDPRANPSPGSPPFSRIDPFFNDVVFSFQVGCDDNLDCAPAALECPLEQPVDFPVDYLARDFVSLRNALLDFAAHRYPEWQLPIEADVGSVLMEVFAALGDEFSYIQDRYAREAFLETATERRSLRKKARLLDYDIHDGRSATTLLAIEVAPNPGSEPTAIQAIVSGSQVWALTEGAPPVAFEVGLGLRDPVDKKFAVSFGWNPEQLAPHWLDGSARCLEIGATEVLVEGIIPEVSVQEVLDDIVAGNRLMLLRTDPDDPSLPRRRHFVHVLGFETAFDPLAVDPITSAVGLTLTRIKWAAQDALPFQIDQAFLKLSLNIVPATAGERRVSHFTCRPAATALPHTVAAVEREGPLALQLDPAVLQERPTVFLFSLQESDTSGLGFLGPSLRETLPEVRLEEEVAASSPWTFLRSLLEAAPDAQSFTLEDGSWRRIIGFSEGGEEFVHQDYASGRGYTLRFGDGVFGKPPPEGTAFKVTYRLNPGALANVAADTINRVSVDGVPVTLPLPPTVMAVTNPWPVLDGADPESASDIKLLTPEAFRADYFFAVTPDDYAVQTARLPFVQRGSARLRWTGSWNTVFASADPFGSFTLSDSQRAELEGWLDCVRQAGRDVVVQDPEFRTLDLEITICVEPFAYAGEVTRLVSEALLGRRGARPKKGFFDPDNFTFGTQLQRSALEAVIQDVPGVRAVLGIRIRSRGRAEFENFDRFTLEDLAPNEVIELENDPAHPERGTLRILTEGGA
jgi:hypothetical protein